MIEEIVRIHGYDRLPATLLADLGNGQGFQAAAGQPMTITFTSVGATPNPASPSRGDAPM